MGAAVGGRAAATAEKAAARSSNPLAIVLLGWVGAIKTTGATLATVSLVDAARDLDLSPFMRSASAGAISLAIAATAVAAGVAADRLGRRRVLMWSYVVAAVANLVVFLFPAGPVYLTGLTVAGIGYGAMITGSYAYVKAVAPGKSLGMGLGLFAMFTTIVSIASTLAGGALAYVDWRWLFAVVPVMCLVSFVLTPRLLPPMPREGSGPIDLRGLALLGAGMMLFILGVSEITAHPPERFGWIVMAVGVLLLIAWVVVELRGRAPAFPVRIFKSRRFAAAVVIGLAGPIATAGMAMSVNVAVQYLRQGSAFSATLALEPFYLAGGIGGLVAGRLLSKGVSERKVMTLGPLVAAAGFLLIIPLQNGLSVWVFLPGILLAGGGLFAAMTAQGQVIVHAVTRDAYGAVTSSKTTISQLGSALGMVLTLLMLKVIFAADLTRDLKAEGFTAADASAAYSAIENAQTTGTQPALQDLSHAIAHAAGSFGTALDGIMLLSAGVMIAAAAAVWVLMRERRPR